VVGVVESPPVASRRELELITNGDFREQGALLRNVGETDERRSMPTDAVGVVTKHRKW
jgi:hypothetical protein